MRKLMTTAALVALLPMVSVANDAESASGSVNTAETESAAMTVGAFMAEQGLSLDLAITAAMSADSQLTLAGALAQGAEANASPDELLAAAFAITGNETLALQALFEAAGMVDDTLLSVTAVRTAANNAGYSESIISAALNGAGLPPTAGGAGEQAPVDGGADGQDQALSGDAGGTDAVGADGGVTPPPARQGQPIS
tara:strand:- start:1363 stop:1953 length:591 start_codon:yes stop_codon:yes gene_type:complete